MITEAKIESGCAQVAAGTWLTGLAQPTACAGTVQVRSLKGFIVPDRACVRQLTSGGEMWCAAANRPFLTRLDALPDVPLNLVSTKLLVAPFAARTRGRSVKLVPLSFARALPVTCFQGAEDVPGWAVAATRSRTVRVALDDGGTLMVRPEAVVAWIGPDPSGFCPKLSVLDMLLPRGPKNLAFSFHGPSTVWFEGSFETPKKFRQTP